MGRTEGPAGPDPGDGGAAQEAATKRAGARARGGPAHHGKKPASCFKSGGPPLWALL